MKITPAPDPLLQKGRGRHKYLLPLDGGGRVEVIKQVRLFSFLKASTVE
jgi:hypothetical protein